jgi:hypothetical protein
MAPFPIVPCRLAVLARLASVSAVADTGVMPGAGAASAASAASAVDDAYVSIPPSAVGGGSLELATLTGT